MRTVHSSSRPGGGLHQAPPWEQTPREQAPPESNPPPDQAPPSLWTEWQTGVKILPCPKLRLRAVTNYGYPFLQFVSLAF